VQGEIEMSAYSLRIEMPGAPRTNSADNLHWRIRQKEKKNWLEQVGVSVHGQKPDEPLTSARVHITRRTAATRAPDQDNLYSASKFILDALVRSRILLDDNQDVITEFVCRWEPGVRGKPSTVVEVWGDEDDEDEDGTEDE
jgi:Holliday junction resolvase RusA-like endonuclease